MISYIYGIIEGLKWANVITDVEGLPNPNHYTMKNH